jgi:hypothetical protein
MAKGQAFILGWFVGRESKFNSIYTYIYIYCILDKCDRGPLVGKHDFEEGCMRYVKIFNLRTKIFNKLLEFSAAVSPD